MPGITILGKELFAKDEAGKLISRIGTVFPHHQAIVTERGPHAWQRGRFIDWLNERRQKAAQPPLDRAEESAVWNGAVDLIIDGDTVLIRPDPENLPLAFEADALLQKRVPKYRIRLLGVLNEKIRVALKRRGECWRMTPLPMSRAELEERIQATKIGIHGREIYFYNATTGTHHLTYQEFAGLGRLDDAQLRRELQEIREFSARQNAFRRPEIAFYQADGSFVAASLAEHDFASMDDARLRAVYEDLRRRFEQAVPPEFREDAANDPAWQKRMFSALISDTEETVSEELLLGLSPEFFMQIRWLPGGRMSSGELMFDEFFEQQPDFAGDPRCKDLYDENAREFLYNLVREYDDLEYVNIGRVVNSLSRREESSGRRDVYIAVMKQPELPEETVGIIRMQKWGVRERLCKGVGLLQAMYDSEEYTQYVVDRRDGCRHLGMNIARRFITRKICERHLGPGAPPDGITIWSPYFVRPYIRGVATDKIPQHRLQDPAFAVALARLLGMAAASNIIVGRCDDLDKVMFDDGDEVLIEDAAGMPLEIIVADQTGTFWDFQHELTWAAAAYSEPVNRRIEYLPDPGAFAVTYLRAFVERFLEIQRKYRDRRRAYQRMFTVRRYDERGSFIYRWQQVLDRLDRTDPRELEEIIRKHLAI